jgi:16S rRNA (guanine527-N7)-methyltransferase
MQDYLSALEAQLEAGAEALGMGLTAERRAMLLGYLALLGKWNKAYNLTGVRDPKAMVTCHLLDSLAVWPYLYGQRLIDVGTGAGLPGMVLALAEPERHWVLLDSSAKKIRFLTQVLIELKPVNVEIVRARVEDHRPECLFDTVITRAFGPLTLIVQVTRHLCANGGRILAMKGGYPQEEIMQVRELFLNPAVYRLVVPGRAVERHLVVLKT